jgi:hypothetical protein
LKQVGLEADVLDRDDRIGASWLRRYERLRLHTVRGLSGLAHLPIPSAYPRYVPKDLYAQYLREYVRSLGLRVKLGCSVSAIRIEPGAPPERRAYLLETNRGTRRYRTVVVATGMYGEPVQPELPGRGGYRGALLHSSQYATGRALRGRRVLVVGLGNTGAEIAADLVETGAAFVAVAVRTAPPVVPRDFLGVPVQLFGIALGGLPAPIADRVGSAVARLALGDLGRYGLRKAQWEPFSDRRIPVIDVGFVRALKCGLVAIRPGIIGLTEGGAAYADGSQEPFDAVIFATGYRTGLERLIAIPEMLDETGYPQFSSGAPTSLPGLYFMGFVRSHRGHLFEIERASRRLARTVLDFNGRRRVRETRPEASR